MKALILAAGLGTRLKPLTDTKPKALVEINGKPLLLYVIEKLVAFGFNDIIVNVHHFSEQIISYINQLDKNNFTISISDESDLLRNTGGGLKHASWFFNDNSPFLIYNVDIISDIDLSKMLKYHLSEKNDITLAVLNRKTSRYLLFDDSHMLKGWINKSTNETKGLDDFVNDFNELAFSGIQIINPSVLNSITEEGVFSVIDVYLRLKNELKISAFLHNPNAWMDFGKINELEDAETFMRNL